MKQTTLKVKLPVELKLKLNLSSKVSSVGYHEFLIGLLDKASFHQFITDPVFDTRLTIPLELKDKLSAIASANKISVGDVALLIFKQHFKEGE